MSGHLRIVEVNAHAVELLKSNELTVTQTPGVTRELARLRGFAP